MYLSTTLLTLLLSSTSLAAPVATFTPSTLQPGQGAVPSCFPLSKLTEQLQSFQTFSAAMLEHVPTSPATANNDAALGVASILSPIDLLAPQVQDLQDKVLADLATVGGKFEEAAATESATDLTTIASDIQAILIQRLWPNAVTLTDLVREVGDCSSGAKPGKF
jgi:hypothetical protein